MAHPDSNIISSQALIAELNRSVDEVTAEISARTSAANDAETTKRNRRFISAKAATLSEAADIARVAARQLTHARTRILDEVERAEAAGFVVQEDFSVRNSRSPSACTSIAHEHAAAIQAALANFNALDQQVSARLRSASNALKDMSDN